MLHQKHESLQVLSTTEKLSWLNNHKVLARKQMSQPQKSIFWEKGPEVKKTFSHVMTTFYFIILFFK